MSKQLPPLTLRQKEILEFFVDFAEAKGIPPTHREICDRFGYSSYGTVHKHLKLLREKGYLEGEWNQKRGLQLSEAARLETVEGDGIPFLGLIAAGQPIEALPGEETLQVPPHLLGGPSDDHYVLRVTGDSMIEEGIHDGDFVIVQRREQAERGEMVVALVGHDATLKRIYPEGPTVRLQPANRFMEAIRVPARDVRVQGVVVGLMRKF
jgi:repressor LexA